MDESRLNRLIDERIAQYVREKGLSQSFTDKKIGDNPTDALQLVNRRYVTLNGTSADRPRGSVLGQRYFDTTLGYPVYWDGTGFVDANGNYV